MNRKLIFALLTCLCLGWAINTPQGRAGGEFLMTLVVDVDKRNTVTQNAHAFVPVKEGDTGAVAMGGDVPMNVAFDTPQRVRLFNGNGGEAVITDSPPSISDKGLVTKANIFGPSTVSGVIQPLMFNGNNQRAMVESTFSEETMPAVAFTAVGAFANCGLKSAYYDWVSVQITGTFDATIIWEGSDDGVTFVPHPLKALSDGATALSTTTAGIWYGDKQTKLLRAKSSAYASGTALVTFELRGR